MLTAQQEKLISLCISDGYGAAKFAISVRDTNRCSERQFLTMQRLHSAAEYRRNNRPAKSRRQMLLDVSFVEYDEGGHF